jgi:murein DD-endopeptidase MepM/ murein hydrolase activator NlpD
LSEPGADPGVLAPAGPVRQTDLAAFAAAGLRLVRLRCRVNPARDVARWRDAGATRFILQLLSPEPARRLTSPQAFVERASPDLESYLKVGVRYVEVHGEPNRADRGAGVSWQDGAAFNMWFEEICAVMRERFGEAIRLGFPALAPSHGPYPDPTAAIPEDPFLSQCERALQVADWIALHVFWRTVEEMRGFDGGMRCLRRYLEHFPEQHFIVTAFANVNPDLSPRVRGEQYAEFLTLMAQYDRVLGASGYLLRSSDRRYSPLAWTQIEGEPTAVLAELAARPRLPDSTCMPMAWPTPSRRYLQLFGANQQAYYRCCQLTGGHNGVDLDVGGSTEGAAPITAAWDGTVTQVAFDEGGYGYHVRVRSYSPEGAAVMLLYAHLTAIEVTVGTLVSRGDLLGYVAKPDRGAVAPHLHLGMQMAGVRLPQVYDGLNPRPYLDSECVPEARV